jgi:hypothetical protein
MAQGPILPFIFFFWQSLFYFILDIETKYGLYVSGVVIESAVYLH